MEFLFVIQARLGSTRLPGKILKPFYKDLSILDILIDKFRKIDNSKVVLATSTSEVNDPLVELAKRRNIHYFRGSENDVLERFIDCGLYYGYNNIIRVCSDNPFLDLESVRMLTQFVSENPEYDYVSFNVNGIPSIKTHYGFWTEFVKLEALKTVRKETDETLYHEHVTNYIYNNRDKFKVSLLDVPNSVLQHPDVRLTIDTEADFYNSKNIYEKLYERLGDKITIDEVLSFLDDNKEYYEIMKDEINKNLK